jgi:chondroitin AC lyase
VEGYVEQLGKDGRWADIDYEDQNRVSFPVMQTLGRAEAIARAFRADDHPLKGDKRLSKAVNLVIRDWMKNRYSNPNWWFASIGIPQSMGRIGILMKGDLEPEVFQYISAGVLGRTRPKGKGQNLVWISECVLYGGLLRGDLGVVELASRYIKSTIIVGGRSGIQHDWSYHLHGAQNQIGYGIAFATDTARYADIFSNTVCALSNDQIALLAGFQNEGLAWTIWRGYLDVNCLGRVVSRPGASTNRDRLHDVAELMARADPSSREVYQNFLKRNRDGGPNDLIGNRYFWRSDLMLHRASDWMVSTRMCSKRTIGAESSNDENLKGYFTADGVTLFYLQGNEYEEIFPAWDWRRLPGTTCRQSRPLPEMRRRLGGTTDFVGGLSHGDTGLAALDLNRDRVLGKKSWFYLDDAVVCLGAAVRGEDDSPVATSINQCLLRGEALEGPGWFWHDSIGYVIPGKQKVTCTKDRQTGKRSDLTAANVDPSTDQVEADVYSISIDHGKNPTNASYHYTVYPGISPEEMTKKADEKEIQVLENTATAQVVFDDRNNRYFAALWKPGEVKLNDGRSVKADRPCLVIFDAATNALSVCDPTQLLVELRLELTDSTPLRIILPKAPRLGEAVRAKFSPR